VVGSHALNKLSTTASIGAEEAPRYTTRAVLGDVSNVTSSVVQQIKGSLSTSSSIVNRKPNPLTIKNDGGSMDRIEKVDSRGNFDWLTLFRRF
jgi:hypothetical protein